MPPQPSPEYIAAKAVAAEFDQQRVALAACCKQDVESGMTLKQIADKLNKSGSRTKTGKIWQYANVAMLMKFPNPPPAGVFRPSANPDKSVKKRKGFTRRNDISLNWVSATFPELEQWRALGAEYLKGREAGLAHALAGVNALIDFLSALNLPTDPSTFLLYRTIVPDFYESMWGSDRTHGKVLISNSTHYFIEWVLTRPEFCEEDDDGRQQRSPAFRNPIPFLTRSGLPTHSESVRSTLPYGYIDELRKMIAEGPCFGDWKMAQTALGSSKLGPLPRSRAEDGTKIAPDWFPVEPEIIDLTDADCVWRTRTRIVKGIGQRGQGRDSETIYEMWSPVRWVALLIKLQLPLRTLQVRLLDSGEADTFRWEQEEWTRNTAALAKGDETRPYANGVFRRPNQLIDGDAKVLLHINTNKTADQNKAGSAKGYNVPWMVDGPMHQDPFYWLEKLRRWQQKYNPLKRLTRWNELDGRHIPLKSEVQLSSYPDTAFLFRTPETIEQPFLPLTMMALDRPWFHCLKTLQKRLLLRSETLPGGRPIELVVSKNNSAPNTRTTYFPLHSLRVSLITALALDGEVPLAILQKIAGHSRLVMTLYYTKPGAKQTQEAIQAGVARLNEDAADTILDWLANAEYVQLVRDVIANSPEAFRAAVPEETHLRSPAGWMLMVDGLCLVGGNNVELDAPGCHNGGPNIGNESSPKFAPVQGGARNCPMCRWFVTQPYFLPQLAARWNNAYYHCHDAKEQVVRAEQRFRDIEDRRAEALALDKLFPEQRQYLEAQRNLEQTVQRFDNLTKTVTAITRLMERCRSALTSGGGTSLVAVGGMTEFNFAIQEVNSELLQVSGVCEGSIMYADLEPGKAVFRQSQLIDAALIRDDLPPLLMTLTEEEQKLVGSALLRQLASQMNPNHPELGRYQIITLIDAKQSLKERLGPAMEDALRVATSQGTSRHPDQMLSVMAPESA